MFSITPTVRGSIIIQIQLNEQCIADKITGFDASLQEEGHCKKKKETAAIINCHLSPSEFESAVFLEAGATDSYFIVRLNRDIVIDHRSLFHCPFQCPSSEMTSLERRNLK